MTYWKGDAWSSDIKGIVVELFLELFLFEVMLLGFEVRLEGFFAMVECLACRWFFFRLVSNRESAIAPDIPIATPSNAGAIPRPMISLSTSLVCAPNAMRIPISCVRCETE